MVRHTVGGGSHAGPLWVVGQFYVWQAIVTVAILSGFNPRNRPPNLFRITRASAIVPMLAYIFLAGNRSFVAAHSTAVMVAGIWAMANLALPRLAPPRDPDDPYQDVIKR